MPRPVVFAALLSLASPARAEDNMKVDLSKATCAELTGLDFQDFERLTLEQADGLDPDRSPACRLGMRSAGDRARNGARSTDREAAARSHFLVARKHGVEDDDQLAHAGDDGDLWLLARDDDPGASANSRGDFTLAKIAAWLASFMHCDPDLEQKTLQPLDNPFGTRLSPMSQVRPVTYVSGLDTHMLAERVSKLVHFTFIRACSQTFKKHLCQQHKLCAGPQARSSQFASNRQANMGRSMDENVRRKVVGLLSGLGNSPVQLLRAALSIDYLR